MDNITASILGLVQGVTEFLPVSSSGHLVICQHILGLEEPELFFDVCLHVGTLIAVVAVFFDDIREFFRGMISLVRRAGRLFPSRPLTGDEKLVFMVILGSIPTAAIGIFAKSFFEKLFCSVEAVGINLIITGSLLWLTHYIHNKTGCSLSQTSWYQALLVGLAQGLAIAPGISRSGSTIATGLFVGLDRDWAARFSFLLFLPAVMGALALEIMDVKRLGISISAVVLGSSIALVSGYLALRLLLRIVRKGTLHIFAPYCWAVGIGCLLLV